MNERKPTALAGAQVDAGDDRPGATTAPPSPSTAARTGRPERPLTAMEANPRRPPSKFGAAADGWDAYNSWLDRVRQPTPPSRQAVIAKALYSVSSYKNWADKARGAFDGTTPATATAAASGGSAGPKGAFNKIRE